MHACLNVDEIVRLIASELVASGGTETAVAFACCRKSFEDPVLDVLWVEQDRLLPLLESFPEGIWDGDWCTVSASTTCVFPFLYRFDSTVVQKTPDRNRMGSFLEVRSEDARAFRIVGYKQPVGSSLGHTTLRQR